MKEEGQKALETLIYKSHNNTATFIQKVFRGFRARKLYREMLAARATMARIFLQLAVKLRWRKLINNQRVLIRDARRRIKKFYRRRYVHFKVLATIDTRIHQKKVKAEQEEIKRHRNIAKSALKKGMGDLFKKKYAEIKKYKEENRERLLAEAAAKKEEERLQKIEDDKRAAEERERQRIEAERQEKLRREDEERKEKLRKEELERQEAKAEKERLERLEMEKEKMRMEELRMKMEAEERRQEREEKREAEERRR